MTAVALIMLNIGILLIESAFAGDSIQDAANAIINGAPLNFTPMATQKNQQTAGQQGNQQNKIVGNLPPTNKGINPL